MSIGLNTRWLGLDLLLSAEGGSMAFSPDDDFMSKVVCTVSTIPAVTEKEVLETSWTVVI